MLALRISFFDIMDCSVNVLGFQFEIGRYSLQEPFFNKDDDNET